MHEAYEAARNRAGSMRTIVLVVVITISVLLVVGFAELVWRRPHTGPTVSNENEKPWLNDPIVKGAQSPAPLDKPWLNDPVVQPNRN